MNLYELYPIIMNHVEGVTKDIKDKVAFQCFLGMLVDYWTATHDGEPHEILSELLTVSDQVNAAEGKAEALAI